MVAVFGSGLQKMKTFDIGSAGHDGFHNDLVNQVFSAWNGAFCVSGAVPCTMKRAMSFHAASSCPAPWPPSMKLAWLTRQLGKASGVALPAVPAQGLATMEFYRQQIVLGLRDYARRGRERTLP